MLRTGFTRGCRIGFALHVVFCFGVAAGAYLGALPSSIDVIPYADKIGHVVLGGLLGGLLDGALAFRPLHPRVPWLRLGPAIVLAVAGAEEIAQSLSPRRSPSWLDYAADAAGVVCFSWALRRVYLSLPADG